jgi:hypothetical protein
MLNHLTPRPTRDMRFLAQCPAHIANPFGQREFLVDVERGVDVQLGVDVQRGVEV